MTRLLQLSGYSCRSADCGSDGLDAIRKREPALVILDYMMPDMSGLDMLREARAGGLLNHVPVVMYSASSVWSLEAEGLELGVTAWIPKGTDWTSMLSQLQAIMGTLATRRTE